MLSGMQKRPKRPRDSNQLAKLVSDMATGEAKEPNSSEGKDPAAVALGRLGGEARVKSTTAAQRKAIAKIAAQKRWGH